MDIGGDDAGGGTLAVGLNTNAWQMGALPAGGVVDTWYASPGYFTVTNSGSVPARLLLSVTNATPSGWAPASAPGNSAFQMSIAIGPAAARPVFHPLSFAPLLLTDRIETNAVVNFDLEFRAPTGTANTNAPQTIRVTVAALPVE